jgi:fibronectin-binding autotransporter adhesin
MINRKPARGPRVNDLALRTAIAAAAAFAGAAVDSARADSFTWTGLGGNNSWSTNSNWLGNVAPVSGSNTAVAFDGSSQTTVVFNAGAFNLNSISFKSEAAAFSINQTANEFFAFFPTTAAVPAHIDQFSNAPQVFGLTTTGLQLNGGDLIFGGSGSGAVTLNGTFAGGGRVVLNSPTYTLTVNSAGSSSHVGFTLNGGTLRVSQDGLLGTGPTIFSLGGKLQLMSNQSMSHAIVVNTGGGVIDASGFGGFINNSVTGTGRLTLTNSTGTGSLGVAGALQQFGGLTITGANNTVTLSGSNNYSGGTIINGGATVAADLDSRFGDPAGSITLDGGTLHPTNSGTVTTNRTITLGPGGGTADVVLGPYGFNGPIGGSGGLLKTGGGLLGLLTANTYAGATTLLAGNTQVLHNQALQNSTLVLAGGGIQFVSPATAPIVGGLSGSGPLSLAGLSSFTVGGNGASTTYSGNITGSGTLPTFTKTGSGTLTLGGSNTFAGAFAINAGTVVVASAGAISGGAGVTIASGATLDMNGFNFNVPASFPDLTVLNGATLRLNGGTLFGNASNIGGNVPMGFGSVNSTNNVSYFGATLSNGFLAGTGNHLFSSTNTLSNVTAFAGTKLNLSGGSTLNFSNVTLGGKLTASGTVNWSNGSITSAGSLIVSGATGLSGIENNGTITVSSGGALTLGSTDLVSGGGSIVTVNSGGTMQLNGRNFDLHQALLNNSGTISSGTINVYFGSLAAGTGTFPTVVVQPGGAFTPGVSLVNMPPPGTASIGVITPLDPDQSNAAAIVLNTNTTATVNSADHALTLSGPMSGPGRTLTKVGGGRLDLGSLRAGGLAVSDGTLRLLPNGGPAGTSTLNTLTIANPAALDLSDNKLIVRSVPVGSVTAGVYSGVSGMIQSGRNGGGWTGSGIVTSQSVATSGSFTSIGVATAAQVKAIADGATSIWSGQTVTGSDTLVMYTYGGDANLDGKINVDDYGHIDSSVVLPGVSGWFNGDFNYDGKINVDDYGIIDSNVPVQGAPFSTAGATGGVTSVTLSAVPEPAFISLLALAPLALRRRRSRARIPSRWTST